MDRKGERAQKDSGGVKNIYIFKFKDVLNNKNYKIIILRNYPKSIRASKNEPTRMSLEVGSGHAKGSGHSKVSGQQLPEFPTHQEGTCLTCGESLVLGCPLRLLTACLLHSLAYTESWGKTSTIPHAAAAMCRLLTGLISRTFQTDAESITREHTQWSSVSGLVLLPQGVGLRNQNVSAVPEVFSHV